MKVMTEKKKITEGQLAQKCDCKMGTDMIDNSSITNGLGSLEISLRNNFPVDKMKYRARQVRIRG